MKKFYTLFSLLFLTTILTAQERPAQPEQGPGGQDYTFESAEMIHYQDSLVEYYWFEPKGLQSKAPLVIFNHGWGAKNPACYGAWIEHLVRKGNIVVFPLYHDINDQTTQFTPSTVLITHHALELLEDKIDKTQFFLVGHSFGGVVAANMAAEYDRYNLPEPAGLMLCQPGHGGMRKAMLDSYANIPSSTRIVIVMGEGDLIVYNDLAYKVYDETTATPSDRKTIMTQRIDWHGSTRIRATHAGPLAVNMSYDSGERNMIIGQSLEWSRTDVVDFYCYWKLLDALIACSTTGNYCEYAFGGGTAQTFMGEWSDGKAVNPMTIDQRPSSTSTEESSDIKQ